MRNSYRKLYAYNPKPARAAITAVLIALLFSLAPLRADWWRDAVFYQIFVRSFQDAYSGPLAGDGIGDFSGLIERLDYLSPVGGDFGEDSLGVNAVWLLPIHPSPSYHGYDVTDYKDIHPEYGDLNLFRKFLAEAHKRGIRVIIDLVLNHTSSQHPWFLEATRDDIDSPKRDFYIFSPKPLHDRGPWGEQNWHYLNGEYFYGVFWSGMPDLNFNHPPVTEYFRRVARFWLEDVGVDGFRLDAIRFLFEEGLVMQDTQTTLQWLREFREYCESIRPDVFIVGEAWADTSQVADYVRAGSVHAAFEFDLAGALIDTARFGTPSVLVERQRRVAEAFGDSAWAVFLSNHDKERTLSQLDGNRNRAALAATLQLTDSGIPFIYYGEEIGMQGRKPDPDLRTPMQWTSGEQAGFTTGTPWRAVNPDFKEVNVADLQTDSGSLWHHYRRLVQLRRELPVIRTGEDLPVRLEGRGAHAFMRGDSNNAVLVLVNFRDRPSRLWSLSLAESPMGSDWGVREVLTGKDVSGPEWAEGGSFSEYKPLPELPPYGSIILHFYRKP